MTYSHLNVVSANQSAHQLSVHARRMVYLVCQHVATAVEWTAPALKHQSSVMTVMNSLAMNLKKSNQTSCEVIYDNEDIDWIKEEMENMVILLY